MNRLLRLGATALLVWAVQGLVAPGAIAAADDVTIALVAQPYAIAVDTPWTATFAVDGEVPSAPAPTAPVIEARVHAHRPVETRQALRDVLEGEVNPVLSRVTVPVTLTATDDGSTFEVAVPTTNDADVPGALVLARPGIYPLTVDLTVDGEVVATHRTFVERLPPTTPPGDEALRIAVVAGVADPGPDAAPGAMAEAGRAVEGIAASAAALDGPMSVQFPPDVVAQLDDAALAGVRTSLAAAEVLSAPALALDPSSAVAADLGATFSEELRNGEDVLGEALPDTPPQRSGWLAARPLSAPAATLLREPLGYDLLVLGQDDYNSLEGGIGGFHDMTLTFSAALDDGSSLPGMVVHPASRWLDPEEVASHGMTARDGAIAILA
ncbi:MAG TPA: hypothetical protein VFT09_06100, partial [Ilumatobacteraceae bacterium]|nr:hypothetical protein [Ilumatobacteraceae bacterium]